MLVHEYKPNVEGNDYVCGDIHGEYDKLMNCLCKVNFNYDVDRLFSVGDLIDRGPDSLKCLGLLEEPWFYCVKANHEQMMLDALTLTDEYFRYHARQLWFTNGGEWYLDLPFEYRERTKKLLELVNELPNAIQLGDVGIVHAECPLHDWELLKYDSGNHLREKAMWSRRRVDRKDNSITKNIKAVVVGHTPVKDVTVLGNHIYIDSGACFYPDREIIVKSYEELLEYTDVKT